MKIFVIGGCHVENFGIEAHLGFVQQWATHLKLISPEPVTITCRSMVKLRQVTDLVVQEQAALAQADLIVLQIGHFELSWRKRFSELFQAIEPIPTTKPSNKISGQVTPLKLMNAISPIPPRDRLKNRIKPAFLSLYSFALGSLPCLNQFSDELTEAFSQFKPYQKKVVVLTPFPTMNSVDQWLRKASYRVFKQVASQEGFTLVDTFRAVPQQNSYFLADGVHLNSLGHLLVALSLSELPQSHFVQANMLSNVNP